MNRRIAVTLLVLAALLAVGGLLVSQAAPLSQAITPEGPGVAPAGQYHFTNHGTAWEVQAPTAFSIFQKLGWGTLVRAKAAGDQWIHIPIPYTTYIADSPMNIYYVEFCAGSNHGAVTKPTRMDLWAEDGRFLSINLVWPADNADHCLGHFFSPTIWKQDLGMSILLHFANTSDTITMKKAWVVVTP